MQSSNNGLGRYGEEVAARWLAEGGLRILERNWRCVEGELDIVALDGDTIAVCEVKTRSERGFQQPSEGIDRAKADRLRRLAERWLGERWPTCFEGLAQVVVDRWKREAGKSGEVAGASGASGAEKADVVDEVEESSADVAESGGPAAPDQIPPPDWPTPAPPGGVRIDLVAVVNRVKGPAQVEHLRGVI